MGPFAGRFGGEVVYQGETEKLEKADSLTTAYLLGKAKINVPNQRNRWNNFIEVLGATENNLKSIDVKFPLGIFTVVTGVSGSGKSSLVKSILYPAIKKRLGGVADKTGSHGDIKGDIHLISDVEFVDQNPIGSSSRSNPVT